MNRENVQQVIDAIRVEQLAVFNMRDWCVTTALHTCGTAACIAGFAALLDDHYVRESFGNEYFFYDVMMAENVRTLSNGIDAFYVAKQFLDLNEDEANALFVPSLRKKFLRDVTTEEAILVLEHLRDTGEVDWSVTGLA